STDVEVETSNEEHKEPLTSLTLRDRSSYSSATPLTYPNDSAQAGKVSPTLSPEMACSLYASPTGSVGLDFSHCMTNILSDSDLKEPHLSNESSTNTVVLENGTCVPLSALEEESLELSDQTVASDNPLMQSKARPANLPSFPGDLIQPDLENQCLNDDPWTVDHLNYRKPWPTTMRILDTNGHVPTGSDDHANLLSNMYAGVSPGNSVPSQLDEAMAAWQDDENHSESPTPDLGLATSYAKQRRLRRLSSPPPTQQSPENLPPWHQMHRTDVDFQLPSMKRKNSHRSSSGSIGSLRSYATRCSYTSSQRKDTLSAFTHLSLSSGGTEDSSLSMPALEKIGESHQSVAEEIQLLETLPRDHPLKLPGHFYTSNVEFPPGFEGCGEHSSKKYQCSRCSQCNRGSMFYTVLADIYAAPKPLLRQYKLDHLEIYQRDRFDNSALHMAAALGTGYSTLKTLIDRGASLHQVNTAGQTFMHVLDPCAMANDKDLPQFLSELAEMHFDFSKTDDQGSTILGKLLEKFIEQTSYAYQDNLYTIPEIFRALRAHLPLMVSRDNIGRTVPSHLLHLAHNVIKTHAQEGPIYVQQIHSLLSEYYGIELPTFYNATVYDEAHVPVSTDNDATLDDLIIRAHSEPHVEDSYGRNGLHCVVYACAVLKWGRFLDSDAYRISRAKSLVERGVSVNSYDKMGRTPLLALLQCVNAKIADVVIREFIGGFIDAGANVNSRDRLGKSSLHIAVKRGLITATQLLLRFGANIHARETKGKGVVQLGREVAHEMRRYKSLHIRIMTCINLVMEKGAIDSPTVCDEWSALKDTLPMPLKL
ncbi:MAG: hypothetical protein Q9164_006460, partial [Protoblastenia rupestris]